MTQHGHGDACGTACCLRVENLGVRAGEQILLDGVNLHIHCGEIVAVIGPNGAGKTTFFRAILGQSEYSGVIAFEAHGHKTRPLVGYVPQSPAFDAGDPISVLDLFVCAISNWPVFLPIPTALRARVADALARVRGAELIDKRMGALSGGELQRVLLAMALEPLPHVLILDEPLSGVDIEGERRLLEMLDEVREKFDLSILLSTHDFGMLDGFADKVVLLNKGVLMEGAPGEVFASEAFRDVFRPSVGRRGAQ